MPAFTSRLRSIFGLERSRRGAASRVDRVAAWLYVGPALPASGYGALRKRGVTHVLDLRAERSDDAAALAAQGLRWRRYPLPDGAPPTHRQLDAIVAWLDGEAGGEADAAGQTLFVHCQHGLTRAPTVAMALLLRHGHTLTEAYRLMSAARPEMMPTAAQLAWLSECEARVRAEGRLGPEPPAP